MRVAVRKETASGERRVAIVPDVVPRLVESGFEVHVEAGAGAAAHFSDEAYRDRGAVVSDDPAAVLGRADVLLTVQPPDPSELDLLPEGAAVIGLLQPGGESLIEALARRKLAGFSLELLPRISRAQSMDALSSQASVAGYRAALLAAERLPKFFPMLVTAAGTIPPAKVLVLGAGVAGLQAIATARRLGGVVSAYDVRQAAAEEVRSLGARFVSLELESQDGAGGYAAAQSAEFLVQQRLLLSPHVADADSVITTAAIPGRRAPLLVTTEMVEGMRPGSVIVDLAAESGGNCELSRPGEEVEHGGVTIVGVRNLPASLATHASQLYARNLASLVAALSKDGQLEIEADPEIGGAICVTRDGELLHETLRRLVPEGSSA
jgi:H+-translocating NAD(P) transhydrogenase subunit alpha